MAQNETWLKHDLLESVKVQYLDGNLFSMDNAGNLIGVTLTRDGEDYSGGGSVSANVIRSDGGTVAVIGALSGKTATVVLPQAAYAVPGVVSIIVKLTASGQVTTIAALVANVYRSSTDTAIDPGTIIPSIQTLISQINTAVASIPADYSALWTKLAPAFSTDASYVAGQYVTYNSGLWRFNTTHSGSWSSSDVTAVNLGGEISDLKSAIDNTVNLLDRSGKDNVYFASTWERADTWNDGTIDRNIKYRVSSTASFSFDRDIIFDISTTFQVKFFYMNGTTVSSRTDWINGQKLIKANQVIRACIRRASESTSETADITEFVNAIKFDTYPQQDLYATEAKLSNLELALKERKKVYKFFWEQGGFNTDGTEKASGTLIRTYYLPFTNGDKLKFVSGSMVVNMTVVEYDGTGTRTGSTSITLNSGNGYSAEYAVTAAKIRLQAANSSYSSITPAFGENICAETGYEDYTDAVKYELQSQFDTFSPDWENGGYNGSGEPTTSASQIRTGFIPTGHKTRLLDVEYEMPSSGVYWFYVLFGSDKSFISVSSVYECGDTVTIPDTAYYIRVVMTKGNPTVYTDGSMITVKFLPFTKWYGKKVSVLGDSLSTYNGTSVSGDTAYYPQGNVNKIEETWWYRLIKKLGMTLEYCNAYGGSTVTKNNWGSYMCDDDRLSALGEPDLILFCGGTNDIYSNMNVGQWEGYDITTIEADTNTFIPAYTKCLSYMQDEYGCRIVSLTPCFIIAEGHSGREYCTIENIEKFCNAINEVCSYMGVELIDTRKLGMTMFNTADYTIDDLHWNCDFMKLVTNELYRRLTA